MKIYTVNRLKQLIKILASIITSITLSAQNPTPFIINDQEYFEVPGLNVMVYHDYYPTGYQSGVTIIQNGERVAANGDVRLTPSQRPFPEQGDRVIDGQNNEICVNVWWADSIGARQQDLRYPYPDINITCTVKVRAVDQSFRISVDLDRPVPEKWADKLVFLMELFPGQYFDKTFYMDETPGLFPRQINGPVQYDAEGTILVKPLAIGRRLVVIPESEYEMITFETFGNELQLVDGRAYRNNGWFTVQSTFRRGVTENAVEWRVTPAYDPEFIYKPVIQLSQVGYHPGQKKIAMVEMDKRVTDLANISLLRVNKSGGYEVIKTGKPTRWGTFLRYQYARFDFTDIKRSGMYKIRYGESVSDPFLIHDSIFKRHVWQPTLEYYLPVQMCHMRVNDRVKVWHGLCHNDDALMAPVDHFHFDGYRQGPSTLTHYNPRDPVPGLNVGGWHDAGDYDLRVESQANTVRMLSFSWELFRPDYDETTVDQPKKLVEIHRPDGQPDILQQIEHGVLTIIGGYKALNRLYRGIITSTGRQYSLLGDGSTMTDNLFYDASMAEDEIGAGRSGIMDDRWVFTEDNPRREIFVATCLANAYRSLKGFRDDLANDCLEIAVTLWDLHLSSEDPGLIDCAAELYLSTVNEEYLQFIFTHKELITGNMSRTGPALARIAPKISDESFMRDIRSALIEYAAEVKTLTEETPYGVHYRPRVWGAGWDIQSFGVNQYFLHKGFPDIFSADPVYNSMNFVLGAHPGSNTASFVSGVGARSLLVAYGVNRDDWSYIPGGSASGTALIRPDLPELKTWPYLWQQTEYVMGGGATNYMFLVLAADDMLVR